MLCLGGVYAIFSLATAMLIFAQFRATELFLLTLPDDNLVLVVLSNIVDLSTLLHQCAGLGCNLVGGVYLLL